MKVKSFAKLLGVATIALGLATGCSSTGTTEGMAKDNNQEVKQIIADAKAALDKASKGGYAWRDTGKMIKQAEKALADGDTAKATSLATKALEQSELARKQSIEQDKMVKERFSS